MNRILDDSLVQTWSQQYDIDILINALIGKLRIVFFYSNVRKNYREDNQVHHNFKSIKVNSDFRQIIK